jgi:hypothetical protein
MSQVLDNRASSGFCGKCLRSLTPTQLRPFGCVSKIAAIVLLYTLLTTATNDGEYGLL